MNTKIGILSLLFLILILSGCIIQPIYPPISASDPVTVTRAFYQDWLQGKYSYSNQSYRQIPIWDKKLTDKIEQIIQSNTLAGYDPVVCAQEIPSDFDVNFLNMSNNKAHVLVVAKFANRQIPVDVTLRKDGDKWLMEDINCPMKSSESNQDNERLVREYLDKNISVLSSVKEVLGGKFRVGDVSFIGDNSGLVTYDDGHILLSADFQYVVESEEVKITSFVVRPEENTQPK